MQAEKARLVLQVEHLTSQQALAKEDSAQRDESIKVLQEQLAQMKHQMDASSAALQALEDGAQDQVSLAESRLDSEQRELEQVQLEKSAADEATQQAVQKFAEVSCPCLFCILVWPCGLSTCTIR
jgi:hypothetical protein